MKLNSLERDSATHLDYVRQQTRIEHSKLDSLPISLAITSDNVTIKEYGNYLQLMYSVVLEIEKHVYPLLENVIQNLDLRSKLGWIKNDLQNLSIEVPENVQVFKFNSNNRSFALGIAYVIEGSTLGGRYMLKNITKNLALDKENGASYLSGYDNLSGLRWKNFISNMDSHLTLDNREEVVLGARFAFQSIYDHLNYD